MKNRSAFSVAQRDTWGGYGTPGDYPDSIFSLRSLPSQFSINGSGSSSLEPYYGVASMSDLLAAISAIAAANGDDLGPCDTYLCPDPQYSTDRRTTETQQSVYLQANLSETLANMPWKLSVGLRYEETDIDSSALVPTYDRIVWANDNEFVAEYSGEVFTNLKGAYNNVLPSLDFNIEILDDVILRASYSETITRPSYSDIQGGKTINGLLRLQGGTGNFGNPDLQPISSKNYDFSSEWYYGEGSYASVGYYLKKVNDFIGTESIEETVWNLPHPGQGPRYDQAVAAVGTDAGNIRQYFIDQGWVNSSGQIVGIEGEDPYAVFRISQPVNKRVAEVDGFEIALQHLLGDSGFGGIINYTTVNGDIGYDNYNTNKGVGVENQFAIFGLSDTFNIIGFYDKHGIQARIAYNWRDEFLVSTVDGNGELNPIYNEEYGQWDINVSYAATENLTVFAEGINITDEYQRLHGRHVNMVIAVIEQAPRYNIGLRYNF